MNKSELRDTALELRVKDRLSLKAIARILRISKSTASLWLRDYPLDDAEIRARTEAYNNTPDGRARMLAAAAKGRAVLEANPKPIGELKGWSSVRSRVFKERGRKCERCGWDKPNPHNGIVPVQVDHINGDPTDHRSENLIVLCPNCHSLTEHFMFYGRSHEGKWGKKGSRRLRV